MPSIPSVEPEWRPEAGCKGHVKVFNRLVSHMSVAWELPGWAAACSDPSVHSSGGWCVQSCVFLKFLALPRTVCPWVGGRAAETRVLLSALLRSGVWKDSLTPASTEAPAAVNVECCALLICHVPFVGRPLRRVGGKSGIPKGGGWPSKEQEELIGDRGPSFLGAFAMGKPTVQFSCETVSC